MERVVLSLEKMADAFGGVTYTDNRPGGRVRTRVKAREYLRTLGYSTLFMERERVLELINKGDDFILSLRFPDAQNPKIKYTMFPSEYLELVNQKIDSFSN